MDIKIGPNSRRDDKSQSGHELRIKADCTRRQSSWNQPNWERWKSIFYRPPSACFWILGAVRFIGYLSDPSGGEWIGIELDHQHPQGNDVFFDGVRYFTCAPRHGLFARPSVVFHHKNAENIITATNISLETIAFIQTNIRRFLARIRLEKFKQRSGIEKQIDAHVFATPAEQTESVEKLSAYLTSRPSVVFHHKNVENVTAAMSISLETIAFIQTNIRRCCFSNVNYFDIMWTRN